MRMYRFSQRIDERVRMVAQSQRERMVAHDIADAPFLLPVMMWCRTLFEQNSSVRFFVMLLGIAPIDEIQVEPCLMMAALIGWTQAESFAWGGKSTMHAYLPIPI